MVEQISGCQWITVFGHPDMIFTSIVSGCEPTFSSVALIPVIPLTLSGAIAECVTLGGEIAECVTLRAKADQKLAVIWVLQMNSVSRGSSVCYYKARQNPPGLSRVSSVEAVEPCLKKPWKSRNILGSFTAEVRCIIFLHRNSLAIPSSMRTQATREFFDSVVAGWPLSGEE